MLLCYWSKREQIHPRSLVLLSWWKLTSVLLEVNASCFTLPSLLLTHIFFLYSFSGYIILTHMWNSKLFPLSICRGYLYDTSSHPSLRLISSHHAQLCMLVGKLSGAVKRIRLSSIEYFDLWVTGRDAFRHRQMRCTVCILTGNSRGEAFRVQTQVTH